MLQYAKSELSEMVIKKATSFPIATKVLRNTYVIRWKKPTVKVVKC